MMPSDDLWPCAYCREPAIACGCAAAMCCTECGEFWQHCACERELEVDEVEHVD